MRKQIERAFRKMKTMFCDWVLVFSLAALVTSAATGQVRREEAPADATARSREQSNVTLSQGRTPQDLQQFVCELYNADKHKMQAMALEELPRIGGWYSIQFYRELLSPAALIKYRKARTKPENRNTATKEPVWWSLVSLPKVAPNPPPIPPPDSSFDSAKIRQYAQIWRDWIQANEATLRTLQPTGEGVDFSGNACRKTKSIPFPSKQGEMIYVPAPHPSLT